MTVARVTEISAASSEGFEEAIMRGYRARQQDVAQCGRSLGQGHEHPH